MITDKLRVGEGIASRSVGPAVRTRRGEPVEIEEKRFGYFPQRFRRRGRSYRVDAVERCWTRGKRHPQLCFRVRCEEGVFDLLQDVKDNIWTLTVVRED